LDAIAAETYARRLQESTPAESAPALPGSLSPSAAYLSEPDLPRRSSDLALPAGNEPAAVLRFAYGSARLGAEDLELLREVAEVYRARGGRLRVVGHSSGDSSSGQGSARPTLARISANFAQSQERADAVAEALRAYGVPAEALLVEARGDSAPLYRETTPAGAFGNRRVEIFLE
jgi:outer membrane protein OmpA-like peptidoglycan-associated protein